MLEHSETNLLLMKPCTAETISEAGSKKNQL